MNVNLRSLRVLRVIAHEVPIRRKGTSGSQVIHSAAESSLDPELRNYFRERILRSLRSAGFEVTFVPSSPSPVPMLVFSHLRADFNDFIATSQSIADHLYMSQTGVNSPGLLCLVEVVIGTLPGLVILKLDKEAAIQIEQVRLHGDLTFDLQHVRNLILSQRTKIFKAGIFVLPPDAKELLDIQGTVSDNQRGYAPSTEVADFFLTQFLGCKLVDAPEVATKRFFNVTESFIASEVTDPELKARYETALLAELNSEDRTVNPMAFAERYLRLEDRQVYREYLSESEIDFRPFDKDCQLIMRRLRRVSIDFESGVGVLVPPDAFDDQVEVSNMDDGRTRMEILDRLKNVRGH